MTNYLPQIYQQLAKEIDHCITSHCHLLIITLPGLGATHLLQHYKSLHQDIDINYLNSTSQQISDTYNILDVRFDQIEEYFQKANYQQKFAVVVSQPNLLESVQYLESDLPRKFSKVFYLGAFTPEDTNIFIDFINPNINKTQKEQIYSLSGGIPRLTKYLCVNPENIDLDPKIVVTNPIISNILGPTVSAINKTDKIALEKLHLKLDGKFFSPIISMMTVDRPKSVKITINFDLTFSENNQTNVVALNKIESQILDYMIHNNNSITREKIAELKWGDKSYDDFSDLAITKTMRRLRHKLSIYTLKTIPKTGYTLV